MPGRGIESEGRLGQTALRGKRPWVQEEYAEFVPTHVLTLGNVRDQFYLPGDGRDYPGFNDMQGNGAVYGGKRDPVGSLLPQITAIFARYTESRD